MGKKKGKKDKGITLGGFFDGDTLFSVDKKGKPKDIISDNKKKSIDGCIAEVCKKSRASQYGFTRYLKEKDFFENIKELPKGKAQEIFNNYLLFLAKQRPRPKEIYFVYFYHKPF